MSQLGFEPTSTALQGQCAEHCARQSACLTGAEGSLSPLPSVPLAKCTETLREKGRADAHRPPPPIPSPPTPPIPSQPSPPHPHISSASPEQDDALGIYKYRVCSQDGRTLRPAAITRLLIHLPSFTNGGQGEREREGD